MDRLVDFSVGDIIKVHSRQLEQFKSIALNNSNKKRYRLCIHDTPENRQQEMIICVTKADYSRPHKHIGISESHVIIDGSERIILFDDDGNITDSFVLDRHGGYLSYRINSEAYHMSIPITDTVIKLEIKPGPFVDGSNIWAPWSPSGDDKEEARSFIKEIEERVQSYE